MPQQVSQSKEVESCLREGLAALRTVAHEMGATGVFVFLLKDGRTVRNLAIWPESMMEGPEMRLERSLAETLRDFSGCASENSSIGRFLNGTFQLRGTSFLVFSCGTGRLTTVIAFRFVTSPTPPGIAGTEMPPIVRLALVAACSVYEVSRLHSELVIVNERLGTRKLIERAKGLLQAERGLDEEQAYAQLRKLSRQRRVRMSHVASDLLRSSRFP